MYVSSGASIELPINKDMASRIVICAAYVMALVLTGRGYGDGEVLVVAWENYTQTQQGEWMIEL